MNECWWLREETAFERSRWYDIKVSWLNSKQTFSKLVETDDGFVSSLAMAQRYFSIKYNVVCFVFRDDPEKKDRKANWEVRALTSFPQ